MEGNLLIRTACRCPGASAQETSALRSSSRVVVNDHVVGMIECWHDERLLEVSSLRKFEQ